MRKYLYLALLATASLAVDAQNEAFIYGKVYTVDDKVIEGPIRWGKEEVYWTDIFNASKERNQNLRYLTSDEREHLDDFQFRHQDWNGRIWRSFEWYWDENKSDFHSHDHEYLHQFSCQFGEIRALRPTGKKYVEIEMQNGTKFDLEGEGYNDVGLDIKVADKETGEIEISWNRIERIEFARTPSGAAPAFGAPLYGTVEAFGEKFSGFIQWDRDERLSTDKLDGDSDDSNVSIEFGKIKSIERTGSRSKVVLRSGRELFLDGSNDVSSGHRGVIVMSHEFPSVEIPWREFDKVTFAEKVEGQLPSYERFSKQGTLSGEVTTLDGKAFAGTIIFDLDEAYDFELLQGKEGEFEFTTPFRSVKKITPKGSHRALVELRSGVRLDLLDGQDVNERNQGVLVFAGNATDPDYISWENVSEVVFD